MSAALSVELQYMRSYLEFRLFEDSHRLLNRIFEVLKHYLTLQLITQSSRMSRYRLKSSEQEFENSTDDESDLQPCHFDSKLPQNCQSSRNECQPAKYKTELCKNFEEKGACPYRIKCQYAHGYMELAQEQLFKKAYRTRRCLSFWNKGVCHYGKRCQFSHYEIRHQTRMFLKIVKEVLKEDCFSGGEQTRLNNLFI